jgi:hypothetical protein
MENYVNRKIEKLSFLEWNEKISSPKIDRILKNHIDDFIRVTMGQENLALSEFIDFGIGQGMKACL